jgi:hypothetical protein
MTESPTNVTRNGSEGESVRPTPGPANDPTSDGSVVVVVLNSEVVPPPHATVSIVDATIKMARMSATAGRQRVTERAAPPTNHS